MVTIGDLPPDVLEEVLSRVPGRDLVCNCRLVCLQWRDVVDLPALWKRKCQREGFGLAMSDRSILDWKTFYFLCSLKRNLIKNPCGESLYLEIEKQLVLALKVLGGLKLSQTFTSGTWYSPPWTVPLQNIAVCMGKRLDVRFLSLFFFTGKRG
uniref:Uncharacterized protein n=1 Tax=Sphaerodactylus townsendi TaxID=933632 RepID=A0ACB8EEU8_9SAUR